MACYEDKTRPGQAREILIIIFNILISYLGPGLGHTFILEIIWKCRRGSQVASDGNDNDLIKLLRTANILGAVISWLHDNSDQNSGLAPILNFKASWTPRVLDLCLCGPRCICCSGWSHSDILHRNRARPLGSLKSENWEVKRILTSRFSAIPTIQNLSQVLHVF